MTEEKKEWSASSKDLEGQSDNNDLVLLAGIWSCQLDVQISNPFEVQDGSIEYQIERR